MDERELAAHVVELVDQAAVRNACGRVVEVQLMIGGRRVFDLDILRQRFALATRGTVAEGAVLEVTINPVIHHCRACGHEFPGTRDDAACTRCGHFHTEPVSGEEIKLLGIAVDETVAPPSHAPRRAP
jgi:hydrogenase nickel incorporation protein HypA/HybF